MALVQIGFNRGADQSPDEATEGTSTLVADAATAQTAVGTTDTAIDTVVTDATTADTDVGTVVTDNTTTLAAIDTFAAAIIAITGDTYVAHQFVFGGATGLTHAQVATNFALLNTAITDFLAAQAAAVTAKTATALTKTDVTTAQTDSDAAVAAIATVVTDAAEPNDVWLSIDTTKGLYRSEVVQIQDAIERYILDGRSATLTE